MAKSDFIAAQLVSIQAAQAQAISDGLGATWDESATEQKSSDGTLTQADLDAAVAAAVGPLNDQIAALTTQDAFLTWQLWPLLRRRPLLTSLLFSLRSMRSLRKTSSTRVA